MDTVSNSRSKFGGPADATESPVGASESIDTTGEEGSQASVATRSAEEDASRRMPEAENSEEAVAKSRGDKPVGPRESGGLAGSSSTAGNADEEAGNANARDRLSALSDAFREVASAVKPSVVQVSVEIRPRMGRMGLGSRLSPTEIEKLARRFGPLSEIDPELGQFFRAPRPPRRSPEYERYNVPLPVGSASGWIYDERGHVVTSHHVVARADAITLTFHDNSEAAAELLGSDPQTDIALLVTKKSDLRPATLATDPSQQGDIVLAVGSPFRYAFSVSQGIVSATGRRMGILGPHGYEDFIQTDAAINPGNSGGPLANARGEVVGMNTAIASRSGASAGIGFAIPAEMIREVVAKLIDEGKVERGYLGVMISDDKRLLASFGAERGVLVEDMIDGGPADQAGLESGDIIENVDGEPITSAAALRRRVARAEPGETARLTLLRDGKPMDIEVTLEQQPSAGRTPDRPSETSPPPDDSGELEALGKLGFERLQAITPQIAQRYNLDPPRGVLVLEMRPFSAASTAGMKPGDIISHVQGEKVADIDELRSIVEEHDLEGGVRMRVRTPGGPNRFVFLSLEERGPET